jgi:short-subunit dehydrogenase
VKLAGRRVLLTGATGGLGHAIARRLRAEGAGLTLSGRRPDVLEALADETGGQALAADLSDRAAVERLALECADVDVLVANAGLGASGHALSQSVEQIDRALDVNLRASMVLARLLGERMAARGGGHIVFVSSLSGKVGTPGGAIYSATKFGLRGFAQGLRADMRRHGVGVSAIFPTFVSEAGMFVDAGVELPPGVGTVSPGQVAAAVVRAIERNRGEIDVAPLHIRLGAIAAGVAPELAATVSRMLGSERVAADYGASPTVRR